MEVIDRKTGNSEGEVGRQIRMDFLSILPYFTRKNLIIILLMILVYGIIGKMPSVVMFTFVTLGMMYMNYPFLAGEESGLDSMYRLVSIPPRKVVLGRYVFGLIVLILSFALGMISSILLNLYLKNGIVLSDILSSSLGILLAYTLILLIQYPVLFKIGYAGRQKIPSLTMAMTFLAVAALRFLKDKLAGLVIWIKENPTATSVIIAVLLVASAVISVMLSIKFYSEKDMT